MGKDSNGNYHPPKGKPSGAGKSEGLGLEATSTDEMDEFNEITDKYIESPDHLADNVHMRHVNRNTSKGESSFKNKIKNPERDKTLKEKSEPPSDEQTEIEQLPSPMTRDQFKELAIFRSDWCVSIFLDTHKKGEAVNNDQDPVNFKNTLQDADKLLKEKGADVTVIERMLTPGYKLLQDEMFWKEMSDGFGVFISEERFQFIKMNCKPGRKVVLDKTFYMIPLLPTIMNQKDFFLLSLSKRQSKLYKGNAFGLDYVEIANMPDGIDQIISDRGVSTTFRNGNGEGNAGALHGISDGSENDKVYLKKYLQKVDDAVWKQVLSTQKAPLVLCGVEYVCALYKEVSQYNYIMEEVITGNHDFESAEELFPEVEKIVQPYLKKDADKALEKYGNLSATEKTSDNPEEVISASYYGKIEHLFVRKDAEMWGSFDEMQNKLAILEKENEEAENLIDNAVVNTIMNGGDVYILEESMPDNVELAAVFRY